MRTYLSLISLLMASLFSTVALGEDLGTLEPFVDDMGVSESGDMQMPKEIDVSSSLGNAPENWTCESLWYQDGRCDCGCSLPDPDCPRGVFNICERSGCPEGEVPWEHRPYSCMRSACGDGWADEVLGEVCDDGEALNSGGCSADCQQINPGWTCGIKAEGCRADRTSVQDMGTPLERDATLLDENTDSMDTSATLSNDDMPFPTEFPERDATSGGCFTAEPNGMGGCLLVVALFGLRSSRRRSRSAG